jgi:hypothetical protein
VARGPTPPPGGAKGGATPWCGWSLAPFGSPSDFVSRPRKIGGLGFVLSNSKNISCVTFLKHKNSRKQELALWHLVYRLVLENA